MPNTRTAASSTRVPIERESREQTDFKFPKDHHLLITTSRHVFALDAFCIRKVFQSSRNGIAAVRESKDGSGILAVASKNVVVLHDTRRGKEESWGLTDAPEDQVRHMEYSEDGKSLFLSTTADGVVQRYCTERSRILGPVQQLASTPTALAVSPTGHLMLSASSSPPVVYLKNLAQNTASTLIQPNSSSATINCAAFHPERPNVFMLAFADGSVAAYDASKISRGSDGDANDAEIGSVEGVHRKVITTDDVTSRTTTPIVGVSFLSGYKTRAVTAGSDGRCRIIDFARGGIILRTWHVKAPLTTISVLAPPNGIDRLRRKDGNSRDDPARASGIKNPAELGGIENIIAAGRVDGKVNLYNDLGLLLAQKTVSAQEEKLVGLEWVLGPSPPPLGHGDVGHFSDVSSIMIDTMTAQEAASQPPKGLGLPAELKLDRTDVMMPLHRQFTIHPDELLEGTVRRKPCCSPDQAGQIPGKRGFQDLFSPVKIAAPKTDKLKSPRPVSNSPRNRPRISSQTFVKKSPLNTTTRSAVVTHDHGIRSLGDRASRETQEATKSAAPLKRPDSLLLKPTRRTSTTRLSPDNAALRHITFNSTLKRAGDGASSSSGDVAPNANARVLADLRKLSRAGAKAHEGALFSSHRPAGGRQHKPQTWATNAEIRGQEESSMMRPSSPRYSPHEASEFDLGQDIWLTSESENEHMGYRQERSRRALTRPIARQCSRTHVDATGTVSTVQTVMKHALDSSDDSGKENMHSAQSIPVQIEPLSHEVRELFPRSSSLSPTQRRGGGKAPRSRKEAPSIAKAADQLAKSPWARAKAGNAASSPSKGRRSIRKNEFVTVLDGSFADVDNLATALPSECAGCPEAEAKIKALEGEVVRLKAEGLVLKAVLRRHGLPIPSGLR